MAGPPCACARLSPHPASPAGAPPRARDPGCTEHTSLLSAPRFHPSVHVREESGRSEETFHSKPRGERSQIPRWGGLVPLFAKAVNTRANALSKHAAELGEAGHGQVTRTSPLGHREALVSTKGKGIGSRVKTGAARENGRFAPPVQLAHGEEPHLPAAVKGVGT